jgi:hypothetical protein
VNSLGCARVLTNAYSAPLKAGTQVHAKAYARTVELWHDGHCIAKHERCYARHQQILELEHYLDVMYRKPGALAGSRPLEQQRRAGLWPESFDVLWQALITRHGKQSGTKQMIGLLQLGKRHGRSQLRAAVETAAVTGCTDTAAIEHLLNAESLRHVVCEPMDIGELERYKRPLPVMDEYDELLTVGGRQ